MSKSIKDFVFVGIVYILITDFAFKKLNKQLQPKNQNIWRDLIALTLYLLLTHLKNKIKKTSLSCFPNGV